MNPSSTYIYGMEPVLASRNGTLTGSEVKNATSSGGSEHAQRTDSENYGLIPTRMESIGSLQSGGTCADRSCGIRYWRISADCTEVATMDSF